jgi:hypothetical protein
VSALWTGTKNGNASHISIIYQKCTNVHHLKIIKRMRIIKSD